MEHFGALSRLFPDGCRRLGSLLGPNHLGYGFQAWDLRKQAGGSLRMRLEHAILIRREVLSAVGPGEDLVGQDNTTHEPQHGGKLVLPWIHNSHSLGDPED